MKTIKKISTYLPVFMLAACAAENVPEFEIPEANDAAKIVVFGGSTAPGSTRADEFPEPTQLGVCKADQLRILTFSGDHLGWNTVTTKNMSYMGATDIDLDKNLTYRDKWTSYSQTLSFTGGQSTGFAFPALAYSAGDAFEISVNSYTDISLKINNSEKSPEFYFGRLKPVSSDFKGDDLNKYEPYGIVEHHYDSKHSASYNIVGKLFRIVSQLNVKISNVYPAVEKLEMYLSNVPTEIGLYTQHRSSLGETGSDQGYWYPVVAATGDAQHAKSNSETEDGILVCSISDFKDGEAVLSTFLLPSDLGRTVKVKAYIKNEGDVDGGKIIERTRLLRASQDYNLDEETSIVYYSSTELPVYKAASSEFMSYSNVRVNVTGKFSDIFTEESESNIVIEICPNYDGYHEIKIE